MKTSRRSGREGEVPRLRGKRVLPDKLEAQLAQRSLDHGIPVADLRRACLAAGLAMLEKGALAVRRKAAERLPLYLPAPDVRFLQEMCDAAQIQDGADGFLGEIVGDMIRDSFRSKPRHLCGVPEVIFSSWDISDEAKRQAAVQAVVDRWRASKGAEHG